MHLPVDDVHTRLSDPIPTGSLRLDLALGTGGLPRGQITEISGESGKTTICLHVVGNAQAQGEMCAWIDADLSFNPVYAAACGVNIEELYLTQTTSAEQAFDILDTLARSSAFAVIVVDSLSSLVSHSEEISPFGKPTGDTLNPLLSQRLPALAAAIQRNQTTVLITRQAYPQGSKIYHQLADNTARMALPLHAGIRFDLATIAPAGANHPAERILVTIKKNKFSPCFKSTELDIIVGSGFNMNGEILDLGEQLGLIRRQGNHYYYNDLLLGSDRARVFQYLQSNPPVTGEIEQLIRQRNWPAK